VRVDGKDLPNGSLIRLKSHVALTGHIKGSIAVGKRLVTYHHQLHVLIFEIAVWSCSNENEGV